MPVYEYACKSCGEHLEVAQSFKDDPLTTCPACGGPLRKVFGSIGIAFKGSGFYRTDSRSASANGAKADKVDKKEKAATGSDTSSSDGSKGSTAASKGSGEGSAKGSEGSSSGGKDASAPKAKAKGNAKAASA